MSNKNTTLPVEVEPVDGERWVYRVRSCTTEEWYRVDLESYDGNGCCNCLDFQNRHEPKVSREIATEHLRCKHLKTVSAYVLNKLIAASQKNPVFGMTLHAVVRKWWETEKTGENEI